MNAQIIEKANGKFAMIPVADYERLLEMAEELEDIQAFDSAVVAENDENIPSDIVYALLDGENPIKVWRKYREMTQTELAEKSGLTQAMVTMLETGKRKGTVDVLKQLAEAMELDIDDLIA